MLLWAQSADRDRQQLLQLQQAVQKLRQENAELQQGKAREIAKLKSEHAEQGQEQTQRLEAARQRQARQLGGELGQARERLASAELELQRLKSELGQREATLQALNQQLLAERGSSGADRGLLAARLKQNSQRAEWCEARHAEALGLAGELLDRYEARQLRVCEPFTDLWRVGEEQRLQALRDRLFEARLDVPAATEPASAVK